MDRILENHWTIRAHLLGRARDRKEDDKNEIKSHIKLRPHEENIALHSYILWTRWEFCCQFIEKIFEHWVRRMKATKMKFHLTPIPQLLYAIYPNGKREELSSILSKNCKCHKNTIKRLNIICSILNKSIFYGNVALDAMMKTISLNETKINLQYNQKMELDVEAQIILLQCK